MKLKRYSAEHNYICFLAFITMVERKEITSCRVELYLPLGKIQIKRLSKVETSYTYLLKW